MFTVDIADSVGDALDEAFREAFLKVCDEYNVDLTIETGGGYNVLADNVLRNREPADGIEFYYVIKEANE